MPPPKPIRLALAYDSYSVEGETDKSLAFAFETPPLARAAFDEHVARARKQKRLAITDATRTLDGIDPARIQLAWDGDDVARAWLTAAEGAQGCASELLAHCLALPAFARVHEIGIGLERWRDSHAARFDAALDVLADRRPTLTALAFGDYDNRSGHVLAFDNAARIAELYPRLARLRITSAKLPLLGELPALESLALRSNVYTPDAFAALARPWPALTSLALGWKNHDRSESLDNWRWLLGGERTPALRQLRITGSAIGGKIIAVLADSPLLARLATLELRDLGDADYAAKSLQKRLDAFAHVALRHDLRV